MFHVLTMATLFSALVLVIISNSALFYFFLIPLIYVKKTLYEQFYDRLFKQLERK